MREFVPGGIANRFGDLYGNSPFRIIRSGRVVIETVRAGAAIMCGWRDVQKVNPEHGECDPDFAWLARTDEERAAEGIKRGADPAIDR